MVRSNREEKSLRHVAMVAKFVYPQQTLSCKHGRKNANTGHV